MTKGQAALEFISTYGFAFLVLAVALGAISYMGLFNISSLKSSECNFPQGADCIDFALANANYGAPGDPSPYLQVVLHNTYGADLQFVGPLYAVFDKAGNYSCTSWTAPGGAADSNWPSGQNRTLACKFIDTGSYHPRDRYDAVVTANFQQQGGNYTYTITGTVSAAAQ